MTRSIRLACAHALTVALAACATKAPEPAAPVAAASATALAEPLAAPDTRVLGVWRIEQARSAPLIDKRVARVEFRADGAIVGNASCNSFAGRYLLAADRLSIARLSLTRMTCGESLMEQEDRVLTALERAARATVPPHGFLTIQDAEGAVLMRASRWEAQK